MQIGRPEFTNFTRRAPSRPYSPGSLAAEKAEEESIINDAKRAVAGNILNRTYVIQEKKGIQEWVKIGDFLGKCENEEDTAKAERYYEKLLGELMKFAEKSKIHALILKKLMYYSSFLFAITLCPEITMDKAVSRYIAMYVSQEKTIVLPCTTFEGKINSALFQEALCHEAVHALDDLSCYETNKAGQNFLTQRVLKEQIMPMLDEEMKKNKDLRLKLIELRRRKIFESTENKNLSEEEKMREAENSFDKRPVYIIDKNSKEEAELVKSATWCWYELDKNTMIVPLMFYFYYFKQVRMEGEFTEDDLLVLEYIAYGTQIFLSGRNGVLEEKDKKLYELIKNKILPRITK